MADLLDSNEWVDGVYQLEESDPVQGGEGGISNRQAEQLAARTTWLRQREAMLEGTTAFGDGDYLDIEHEKIEAIFHDYLSDQYTVVVRPIEDTEGSLGEVWVEKLADRVRVHRTGEFSGQVHVMIIGTTNDLSWTPEA